MRRIRSRKFSWLTIPLLAAALVFTGCDSDENGGGDDTMIIEGRVTDDAGYGKSAATIEGATVTAATLESDGTLNDLEGEATTDADGMYRLELVEATGTLVVMAEKAPFEARVLVVQESVGSAIGAMPANVESTAEADVLIEVRQNGVGGDVVTTGDVALWVNSGLAAEIIAGDVEESEVAAAIEAAARAEASYLEEDDEAEDDLGAIRDNERQAFAQLQTALFVATSVQAETAAIEAFWDNMIDAYTETGVSVQAQAKARRAGLTALLKFFDETDSEARIALQVQSEIIVAMVTAVAIEESFASADAPDERIDELADARISLVGNLRVAQSESDIDAAYTAYEEAVENAVIAELEIDETLVLAVETVLDVELAILEAAIESGASADEVAEAYAGFYLTAVASAATTLSTSEKADLGADVLTLISVD